MVKRSLAGMLVAAVLLGCRGSRDPDPNLLGEYALRDLDGQPPPVASPDQPSMMVVSLTLRLTADRFELGSTFRMPEDTVQSAPLLSGRWEQTDEELHFFPEQAEPSATVIFRYIVEEPGLVLTDARGHRWTMARVEGTSGALPTGQAERLFAAACPRTSAPIFIDHVIFAVRDLSAAVDSFSARGFTIKPGRPHPDGLLNAHVKFPSAQEIELMSLSGAPGSEVAEEYARILAEGDGGAYLALAVSDIDRATRAAIDLGLTPARPSSGAAEFVSFPADSAAMAVFFGARSQVIDPDSLLTHASGAKGLDQVWIEGDDTVGRLLEELGAVRCGDALRNGRRGERFGLANGEVVVTPRVSGRRPRMLGGVLSGVAADRAWFGSI